ncbi:hypothetical protein ABMA27_001693 [Loxostege sticticalis]|uniref:BPTI/Kunitz inhibitor domain-containing protein n=1 Tax=Loxostege sticticalis TaxID=481309 RepID=A0ABR3HZF9_LOXSC
MPTELETAVTRHVPKVLQKMCLLKPHPGPCRGNIRQYYFDASKMNCSTFRWGGCQGNGNRFDRLSECLRACLSTGREPKARPRYCSLAFDYGFCFGAVQRYYYDKYWKVCKKTIYSGCGGNQNNFYNFDDCDQICRLGNAVDGETTTKGDGIKRKIIINPNSATVARGRAQGTRASNGISNTTKCIEVVNGSNKKP